jgi:hypothetical protein
MKLKDDVAAGEPERKCTSSYVSIAHVREEYYTILNGIHKHLPVGGYLAKLLVYA